MVDHVASVEEVGMLEWGGRGCLKVNFIVGSREGGLCMLGSSGVWALFCRPALLSMSSMKNLLRKIVSIMGMSSIEESR